MRAASIRRHGEGHEDQRRRRPQLGEALSAGAANTWTMSRSREHPPFVDAELRRRRDPRGSASRARARAGQARRANTCACTGACCWAGGIGMRASSSAVPDRCGDKLHRLCHGNTGGANVSRRPMPLDPTRGIIGRRAARADYHCCAARAASRTRCAHPASRRSRETSRAAAR